MDNRRRGIPVIPPNNLLSWRRLLLKRDDKRDTLHARSGEFEWEVETSLNEDFNEYEARVYLKGLKLASGRGKTQQEALTETCNNLEKVETKIAGERCEREDRSHALRGRRQ